jgi:hypothetical protein
VIMQMIIYNIGKIFADKMGCDIIAHNYHPWKTL